MKEEDEGEDEEKEGAGGLFAGLNEGEGGLEKDDWEGLGLLEKGLTEGLTNSLFCLYVYLFTIRL